MYKVLVTTVAEWGDRNVTTTVIDFERLADADAAVNKINSRGNSNNRYEQKALPLNFDV